ncbi:MAG: efflux RND transporter permease subunit [Gammaproteobacteria bacterium]
MSNFEIRFAEFVVRMRWPIIVMMLFIVGAAAFGVQNLYLSSSYRVMFGEDNPQLIAFDEIENKYAKNDNVMLVIAPKDRNVFTPQVLQIVAEVTEAAWQAPYSSRVDSITNFQHTEAIEDDLIVADLVKDPLALDNQGLQRVRQIATTEPLLAKRLVAVDGNSTAVNVLFQVPTEIESEGTFEVVTFMRDLAAQTRAKYPEIDIYLTGVVMMNTAFAESSIHDMSTLVPLSFGVMIVLLVILVGGIAGTVITVIVTGLSIMAALGIHGHLGGFISPPSSVAPTIILTVALANCVHVLITFLEGMRSGHTKDDSIRESLRINLHPVTIASVTTAIGFLTLNFSDVPPFGDLGNMVAIGVVFSMALSLTFLPAVLSVVPIRKPHDKRHPGSHIARLAEFVIANHHRLFWVMGALIVLLIVNIPRNELNDVFVNYFDDPIEFRTHTDFTLDNLTGLYTIDYSLESGSSGGISDPAFLQQVENFANWYRQQEGVIHVSTYTDIMKRLNKNMHGDDPQKYTLPRQRDLAAQYLLLYEMSLPYGLDLNNQINVDKSSLRLTVTLETLSTNEILALNNAAEEWLSANAPIIEGGEGTGANMMFANIGKRNINSMFIGTVLALVLISLILIFALRSLKIGLVSLIPNLAPAAMGFGLWGLLVGQVGLSLSIVTSMTFGIVIDDTVHFLSKYLRARREQSLNSVDSVRYAFKTVGRALLTTTIVLVGGFLVLATSAFYLNSSMGLLTAIIIVFAIIADFLFLPSLLMRIEGDSK